MDSSRPSTPPGFSEDAPDPQTPPVGSFYNPNERLSTTFAGRLLLCNIGTFTIGTTIGGALGSRQAALRFRAENAHRFPASERGWYFYHKSKNYYTALGGMKQGIKLSARLCSWVTMFVVTEEAVDRLRGRSDFLSTIVAGLSLSGFFSIWNKLPYSMAITNAKRGLAFGLVFGLTQDLLRLGNRWAWDKRQVLPSASSSNSRLENTDGNA